jgi:Prokaryotic RING finger family 1
MYRPYPASSLALSSENNKAATVIWWHWDDERKCWRPLLVPSPVPVHVRDCARLIPVNGGRRWALLAGDGVRVNGLSPLPIQILGDRDEVRIGDECYYFSAQSPVEIVAFRGDKKEVRCARCLARLADGTQIVQCPACRAHHHASCWTYDTRCQKCPFQTTGTPWMPDFLN